MLYVATVHYRSPRWIDIQARYLREHLSVDFQTWTSLEGIDPSYGSRFERVLEQRGAHAGKLNHLALEICHVADDDDLIMFLDGDAFPIADPMPIVSEALERAPLVAVRRAENLREPQPHPCFCVTTVRTWRSLPGDWSLGCTWRTAAGRVISDVGGNLRRALELSGTPWVPLLRSNGAQVHPVFFAIYADVLYHHGAGFRDAYVTRTDRDRLVKQVAREGTAAGLVRRARDRLLGRSWNQDANERIRRRSEEIFAAIERGEEQWLKSMQGPPAVPGAAGGEAQQRVSLGG
ncbi:MAG TPA: hypothetical protein VL979_13115 [Solirubrobacteraceae bacterium]|nr:hypothetical protein [Solirubrobacteraceae bacterium]